MLVDQLNLRHLRCVMAVASAGTVAAAAREVHLSQPAITQGVAKLERAIGVRIFDRRSHGMSLTGAGELFLARIKRSLAFLEGARVTAAQIRAFLAVARAGGFASAGRATGLSEAALHRAVSDLAVALGYQLFERHGAGVAMTPKGRRASRRFGLARAELLAGLDEIEVAKGRETGHIAIGAMPLSRARLLPAALARFCVSYPDFSISIAEGSLTELLGPLRDGDLDILVGALRDPSPGRDVRQEPLIEDRPVIVGRAGHPLAGRQPTIAEAARFRWVISGPGTPLREQWRRMFEASCVDLPRVPVECGSAMTIRELLVATDMLTLLSPDQVKLELLAGWLVVIRAGPPELVRTIGMTTRAEWTPTPMQRSFMEQLRTSSHSQNLIGVEPFALELGHPFA